jgi:hypothetical protein
VNIRSVLFIPDKFMDYRMWSDVPDRIRDRAEAIHFDQHARIPWTAANGGFLAAARRLAGDGRFDVVVAAGQAARFGFAVADAGLATGLVFFYPSLDRPLGEVVSGVVEDADPAETLGPYQPVVDALDEDDPGRRREVLLQAVRDTAGPGVDPAELDRAVAMMSDHAEEFFAELRAAQAAIACGQPSADPPWLKRPWIDHLAELTIPVTAVVAPDARAVGEAVALRAADAEIVVARPGLAPVAEPSRSAEALLRMLDRLG